MSVLLAGGTRPRYDTTLLHRRATEPAHWHLPDGRHAMPLPTGNRARWTAEERDYVAHLDAHAHAFNHPHREDGDDATVAAQIAKVAADRRAIATALNLIDTLRLQGRGSNHADKRVLERIAALRLLEMTRE